MKLSIITINYNNLEGLRRTINSVVNQTWQEFEWIIVDGGSTDGSRELIEETATHLAAESWRTEQFSLLGFTAKGWESGNYPLPSPREACARTLLWISEKDYGVYNAMNKGIVQAGGEYCLFLNSGDCFYSIDVLQKVSNFGLNYDIVYGDEKIVNPKSVFSVPVECVTRRWFFRGTLPHGASFIKRRLFFEYGLYDETLKVVSDWKFFAEIVNEGKVSIIKMPYVISIFEGMGVSDDIDLRDRERALIFYKMNLTRIEEDYDLAESLRIVKNNKICKWVYSLLYRFAVVLPK